VFAEGIKAQHLGDEAQQYWDIILEHHEMFHEVPSVDYFKGICPSYDHRPPTDSVESIAHELKTRYLHASIDDALQHLAETNAVDPWEARTRLMTVCETIALEHQVGNTDLVAGADKTEVLRRLERLQQNGGLLGLPWPWDYMNENSLGLMPGNFVYLYGREKSRKTWLLLFIALFYEALGLRVLFCTREMSNEELAWRLYCLTCGFDINHWSKGEVSTTGKTMLEDAMDCLFEHKNIIFTEIEGGVPGVKAKIEEVKPDIVIHDYMVGMAEDLMEGKPNSKLAPYVVQVANGLKRVAMNSRVAMPTATARR
jgi:replicative DNA helicase